MVIVNENPFYYAAAGGIILGISTSINYVLRGKVTGMSGMVYGVVSLQKQQIAQKLSILGGMLIMSGIFFDIFGYGTSNNFTPFGPEARITVDTSYIGYALAGLLVGFGTKLSNGCTSGHGLCGISRFSVRSLFAVCIFLFTAIAISTLRYYQTLGPFSSQDLNPQFDYNHEISSNFMIGIGVLLPLIGGYIQSNLQSNKMTTRQLIIDQLITFIVGLTFGSGLLVSGMVRRTNIIGFLSLGQQWNPSLLFVLGCGVIINLITFNYMIKVKKVPYFGKELFNPQKVMDWRLVVGAVCFGLGWGIGGICPGPGIMLFSAFTIPVNVIWFVCLIIGMIICRQFQNYLQNSNKISQNKPTLQTKLAINQSQASSLIQNQRLHKNQGQQAKRNHEQSLIKIQFTINDAQLLQQTSTHSPLPKKR